MESVKIQGPQSQALRANKLTLVERLADDLAHEIKNPLHSMVINLEVLKRRLSRLAEADPSDLLRYTDILSGELDRVSRRVDLLLRMVRPERTGDPVTLAEAVEDLLEVVELERERQGITIDHQPPEAPSRIRLPRDAARQLVLNLLLVGIDAAGPGGTILITSHAGSEEGDALHLRATGPATLEHHGQERVDDDRAMRSMARSLADAMGVRLAIDRSDSGDRATTCLSLRLPPSDL